jgi:hypothetical protein
MGHITKKWRRVFLFSSILLVGAFPPSFAQTLGINTVGSTAYPTQGLRRVSKLVLSNDNYQGLYGAGIDPTNGYAYFGGRFGSFSKINLSTLTEESTITLSPGGNFGDLLIDAANGYAYFISGAVHKVKLGAAGVAPVDEGTLSLGNVYGALIDTSSANPAAHYAYFITTSAPATVYKLLLPASPANGGPADSTLPTLVGGAGVPLTSPSFPSAGMPLHGSIDTAAGFAYFNCYGSDQICQVALNGANAPTENAVMSTSDPVTAGDFFSYGRPPVVDTSGSTHYAYVGLYVPNRQSTEVKINLTSFTEASKVFLNPGTGGCTGPTAMEQMLVTGLADPASGYNIYGTDGVFPMKIFKIKNNAGDAAPTENPGAPLLLQPGFAMTVCDGNAGNSDNSPDNGLTYPYGEVYAQGCVIDNNAGYAYFGTDSSPGQVIKVAFSQKAAIKGTQAVLTQTAVVSDVKFYSYASGGHLRLGIYDNSTPPNLLWDSGTVANNTSGGWITQNISAGSPSALTLNPGTYWLCWQVDTTLDIPSYATGSAGTGLLQDDTFGAYPANLAFAQTTTDNWSEYLDYTVSGASTNTPTPTGTFTPTAVFTSSLTPTPPATTTWTPAFTLTITPTASVTPSSSMTASPTLTGTATASTIPTLVFTLTGTATLSSTPILTDTPTSTGTRTQTFQFSPTLTLSPTPSNTPTLTDSPTASLSPTSTFSPTVSNTLSASPSPTLTASLTSTGTSTESPTITDSSTPTLSPTLTWTPTLTDNPTETLTLTPTETVTLTLSPTPTLIPTFTAVSTDTPTTTESPTITLSPTPTPTPTPPPLQNMVYPNPWDGTVPLSFYHTVPANTNTVSIKLFTVAFRKVYESEQWDASAGQHLYQLSLSQLGNLSNGIYYLVVADLADGSANKTILKILVLR